MTNITRETLVSYILKQVKDKGPVTPVVQEVLGCNEREARRFSKIVRSKQAMLVEEFETVLTELRAELKTERVVLNALNEAIQDNQEVQDEENKAEVDKEQMIGDEVAWKAKYDVDDAPYYFNKQTQKYVVFLKSKGGYIEVDKAQHDQMYNSYCRYATGKAVEINEICLIHQMPRDYFVEYKTIMGWTHNDLPVTKEDLDTKTDVEIAGDLQMKRKFAIKQSMEKTEWKDSQADAMRWRKFVVGQIDPFKNFLDMFNPKPIEPMFANSCVKATKPVKNEFLLGVSDIHFGGKASADELYSGEEFNADVVEKVVDDYARKIKADVDERAYTFKQAVVCFIGDLLHTLTGKTVKGTLLESDVLREEQFELAFNCLNRFIQRMLEIFGKLEIHAVKGNHAGTGDYILLHSLKSYYRNEPNVTFNLYKARTATFRIGPVAVMLDHGAAAEVESSIPKAGAARESTVQSLFMEKPEVLIGAKQKILIQGDKHHYEQQECKGFEFFMFSSPVTGDHYADQLGLHSRPRQNCLIVGEDGVKEALHYYFD